MLGLEVGTGVGVIVGVALGGRGVCVTNGSRAATRGGTTVWSERTSTMTTANRTQEPAASRPSTVS